MLSLKLMRGDEVFIRHPDGTVIRVEVIRATDGHMRLGFEAPASVEINRGVIDRRKHPRDTGDGGNAGH